MSLSASIAVLLTCHNRRDQTLRCLDALQSQQRADAVVLEVILVDDGSTDGTAAAVRHAHPGATVLEGDGSLFWNGGMRAAFAEALRRDAYDFYLWLNDDTHLAPTAVATLLSAYRATGDARAIVVGSVRHPETGQLSYGGLVRASRWHPFKYRKVQPVGHPVPCEVMNGNCVLVPRAAAATTGNLDGSFTHAIGDFDYALRARRAGCSVWVAPGYVGTCAKNAIRGTWQDAALPLRERWQRLKSPKGLPPCEWMRYARRHAGLLGLFYGSLPYVRLVLTSLVRR